MGGEPEGGAQAGGAPDRGEPAAPLGLGGGGALVSAAALFDEPGRALVRLAGADRAKYAQSMVTNEVKSLAAGEGCLASALTPKAKLVAFARVLVLDDAILFDTDAASASALRDHLRRFIVINKVTVGEVEPLAALAVEGPRARAALARALDAGEGAAGAEGGAGVALEGTADALAGLALLAHRRASIAGAPVRVVRFSTASPHGFRVHVEEAPRSSEGGGAPPASVDAGGAAGLARVRAALAAAVAAEGGGEASALEVERARIARGWPVWGRELDEHTLPPAAGLTAVSISYTKGCYVGQEPIAMLKFRGQLPRTLVGLALPSAGALAECGAPLFDGAIERGRLTSVAPAAAPGAPAPALGYVQREHAAPGAVLRVGAPDGPEAVVEALAPLAWSA